mmetsp:Transcript_28167/g.48876  ORF Transcript_28167/g.48876 Transcript_28167/m.48876 type:complete len:365 (+) Transcript_28167:386-1480(+)
MIGCLEVIPNLGGNFCRVKLHVDSSLVLPVPRRTLRAEGHVVGGEQVAQQRGGPGGQQVLGQHGRPQVLHAQHKVCVLVQQHLVLRLHHLCKGLDLRVAVLKAERCEDGEGILNLWVRAIFIYQDEHGVRLPCGDAGEVGRGEGAAHDVLRVVEERRSQQLLQLVGGLLAVHQHHLHAVGLAAGKGGQLVHHAREAVGGHLAHHQQVTLAGLLAEVPQEPLGAGHQVPDLGHPGRDDVEEQSDEAHDDKLAPVGDWRNVAVANSGRCNNHIPEGGVVRQHRALDLHGVLVVPAVVLGEAVVVGAVAAAVVRRVLVARGRPVRGLIDVLAVDRPGEERALVLHHLHHAGRDEEQHQDVNTQLRQI